MFNIILQLIIGFLLADIVTGGFHWLEDSYFDYCTDIPIIGTIAQDNELHHYFPRSMLAYSYLDHITVSLPLTLLIVGTIYLLNNNIMKYKFFLISFVFFCTVSNIIHRFSHLRECETSAGLKFLQRTGILCSHEHHKLHHQTINEKYCVISEYNNYILDSIGFWRGLEQGIYVCTGLQPKRKLSYNSYSEIHNRMHENNKLSCPDSPTKEDVDELIRRLKEFKNCE
jgi:ubiquitin-conjugating enzyme E2 variant